MRRASPACWIRLGALPPRLRCRRPLEASGSENAKSPSGKTLASTHLGRAKVGKNRHQGFDRRYTHISYSYRTRSFQLFARVRLVKAISRPSRVHAAGPHRLVVRTQEIVFDV